MPKTDILWHSYDKPDLFVALDNIWAGETATVFSCGVDRPLPKPSVPTLIVCWGDARPCPSNVVKWLLTTVREYIANGKKVEIACVGGHGRTGTLLAMLIGLIEKLEPKEAILAVRARYCKKAIESMMQTRQIYEILGSTAEEADKAWFKKPITIYTATKSWRKWWKRQQKQSEKAEIRAAKREEEMKTKYPELGLGGYWDV